MADKDLIVLFETTFKFLSLGNMIHLPNNVNGINQSFNNYMVINFITLLIHRLYTVASPLISVNTSVIS
jgi:hypothetical protein